MQAFTSLSGVAAALPLVNIDTDMIIPKQFLKTIKRTGLGAHLFDEMRFTPEGVEIPDFVLNQAPWRQAQILIAGENFGCGSSREHAPWALQDFGIRCIIAPSFADIFYNNCFKNGILPVILSPQQVEILSQDAQNSENPYLTVDLPQQQIKRPTGDIIGFEIGHAEKKNLLEGLDDIALTLQQLVAIELHEQNYGKTVPWLFR